RDLIDVEEFSKPLFNPRIRRKVHQQWAGITHLGIDPGPRFRRPLFLEPTVGVRYGHAMKHLHEVAAARHRHTSAPAGVLTERPSGREDGSSANQYDESRAPSSCHKMFPFREKITRRTLNFYHDSNV